jgi:hypothetical protein
MEIKRAGTQPSGKEYFTGAVRIDPLNDAPEPARVLAARVTFEPVGDRMATHPLGQTLIMTWAWARVSAGVKPRPKFVPAM